MVGINQIKKSPPGEQGFIVENSLITGRRVNFYNDLKGTGIIIQIALVDAQKKVSVASGDKFQSIADKDKIIVVGPDHGDKTAGRFIRNNLPESGRVAMPSGRV